MRVRRSGALLVVLGALTACAGAPPTAASPELDADVTQYRRDQALGQVAVKLTNRGPADVTVAGIRLEADGFAPGPDAPRDTVLRPDLTVDVPVRYGEPRCDQQATGGRAVLQVVGAEPREVAVPLPAAGVLALVHERECRARALAAAVDLRLSDDWPEQVVDGRPVLRPTLLLTRRSGREPVVVQDVAGHVLFTVRARPDRPTPLLVLGPDEQSAELRLELVTSRCDGHALAESKRTPVFLFYVALGDDEPRRVEVTAPTAVHPLLSDVATRTCVG